MSELSSTYQRRALDQLCQVPPGLKCPHCRHGYDIVVSRRQMTSGSWMRRWFRFFRCRVCGCRFRIVNSQTMAWPLRVAVPVLAMVMIGLLATAR